MLNGVPNTLVFSRSKDKADMEMRLSRIRGFGSRLLKLSAAIRAAGFSHNDIKPENILFVSGRPVVADFDSFSRCGEEAVLTMTSGYVPPELQSQRTNASNPPSNCLNDLFAIGATLYELLVLSYLPQVFAGAEMDAKVLALAENELSNEFIELEKKAKDLAISKKAFADLKWLETIVRKAISRDTADRVTAYDQL